MTSIPNYPVFKRLLLLVLVIFTAQLPVSTTFSEDGEKDTKEDKKEEKKDEIKTIAEVLKDCETKEGLFPLHQDRKTGKLYLQIAKEQITTPDKRSEFIHFSHTLDGVTGLGLFRGQFSNARVFTIRRHFEKIEFVAENSNFYFNPDSALKRAANANISDAILSSSKIAAADEATGSYLVEAESVFLKEFFRQLKPGKKKDDKDEEFKLGDLSDERTRFIESKSFPDNTLFRVQYVFENLHPSKYGDEDVADSRFVTIKVQHTLIAMPENDYEPRFTDPRVGYFSTQVTDLTSKSSAPYRDLVHRWHLKKKNPEAELSPPIEPITWWIENTTPVELRDTIRDAVLAWNLAYESAGFSGAIEVKIQPDDADWDADDIRYHVLRWTSSPNPPFGGYGPSFVNPRTGEILGSDIMLEYIFLTNRIRLRELIDLGHAGGSTEAQPAIPGQMRFLCQCRSHLHSNRIAGEAMLRAMMAPHPDNRHFDNEKIELDRLIEEALTDLVLHEVGHTIGLNHNFRASHLYDREAIQKHEKTATTGLTASVMDYSPTNLSRDPAKQGHYFSVVPGPYDHWAVRFGYGDANERNAILSESTKPEHAFANDADDMRTAGRGIDPRAMVGDLTSEPILYAADQIAMVRETLPKLETLFPVDGESYHELRTAFSTLMLSHARAGYTMSRFIGGVYIDRSMHAQEGSATEPFLPVPAGKQRLAMKHLAADIFGPEAFNFSPTLLAKLQMERRGFDFFELDANEDPKVHESVLAIQKDVLAQLLHKNTLARIIDSGLYGNDYSLEEFMESLHAAVLTGDPAAGVNSFREALQIEYIEQLIKISGLEESASVPAAASSEAILLLEQLAQNPGVPESPQRHARYIERRITRALEHR
ncbi:MAG: zinc-dependent metalloprotease [Verrucomicrobiales bacterium]|nr:zinc-dependent metalloprotease [Verrucomicrobiales bacterium]